jgi:DNA-binding SARP family transcriptional activator
MQAAERGVSVQGSASDDGRPSEASDRSAVLIGLLGPFCLLKAGQPVMIGDRGKARALLAELALGSAIGVQSEVILTALWPQSEPGLARQSLHSLAYSLHKLLGDAIGGEPPVVQNDGCYRLNLGAGVVVDVARFDALVKDGEQQTRRGQPEGAASAFSRAIELYRGDLSVGEGVRAVIERERLRATYLTLLARLADHHYARGDLDACLRRALQLLTSEPCREDAHRLVMRCFVRRGERGQALRQYRICQEVLRTEFEADPEPATRLLFEQLRSDPGSI